MVLIAQAELYEREWQIGRHCCKPPAEARQARYERREGGADFRVH